MAILMIIITNAVMINPPSEIHKEKKRVDIFSPTCHIFLFNSFFFVFLKKRHRFILLSYFSRICHISQLYSFFREIQKKRHFFSFLAKRHEVAYPSQHLINLIINKYEQDYYKCTEPCKLYLRLD